jgi:hypothetical protein
MKKSYFINAVVFIVSFLRLRASQLQEREYSTCKPNPCETNVIVKFGYEMRRNRFMLQYKTWILSTCVIGGSALVTISHLIVRFLFNFIIFPKYSYYFGKEALC